jgi:ATP-binding cassette subfamily C (CFTR/MRP) protein 1
MFHRFSLFSRRSQSPPPPGAIEDATVIPLDTAGFLSILTYAWISPMMQIGYRRPLEVGDLWKVEPSRESHILSQQLNDAWLEEQKRANDRKTHVNTGVAQPNTFVRLYWYLKVIIGHSVSTSKERWKMKEEARSPSLVKAMSSVFGRRFMLAGLFKFMSDMSQITAPILTRVGDILPYVKRN